MKVVFDIECNRLEKPDKIWVVVCKDIDTGKHHIFRKVTEDEDSKRRLLDFAASVETWIGHNIVEYDLPIIDQLIGIRVPIGNVVDTLILSRLTNFSRIGGHSLASYGEALGLEKLDIGKAVAGHNPFFNQWSEKMEEYCVRDTDISHKVYLGYLGIILDTNWHKAIELEHKFQRVVNGLQDRGFGFNTDRARVLLSNVTDELALLDEKILKAFQPKEELIREFTPKLTKFGTISRTSVPRALHHLIHEYECGMTYRHTRLVPFNPASHRQIIEVLNEAGWKPEERTQAHIDTEREINLLKKSDDKSPLKDLTLKLEKHKLTGWKVNEGNLSTLPETAPEPARLLAKRILLESRRRTLTEWLGLVSDDGRIRGRFQGIGAWTHRMSHQKPNTANIPNPTNLDGTTKLLGKEMRELWCAPKNRLLVGVDAEGIQLRIFAHYIDDEEFTNALVHGKKSDKSDPHSLNQRVLGDVCKTRAAAKRFVFALLLGGGLGKLAQILGCTQSEARSALDNLLERYTGFAKLRKTLIPADARRGYFIGLDGRKVPIPGTSQRDREHLAMSGYLQNGEKIVVATAAVITREILQDDYELGRWLFVDIIHDELQSEVRNSKSYALQVAAVKAEAIVEAGRILNLKCPMAGSYFNDDTGKYTIGTNWYATH